MSWCADLSSGWRADVEDLGIFEFQLSAEEMARLAAVGANPPVGAFLTPQKNDDDSTSSGKNKSIAWL